MVPCLLKIFICLFLAALWVFIAVHGLLCLRPSGAALRCGVRASHCCGFSYRRAQALGSRASVVVECGIFPDQGSNPCPLHWQADSQPLGRSLNITFFKTLFFPSLKSKTAPWTRSLCRLAFPFTDFDRVSPES